MKRCLKGLKNLACGAYKGFAGWFALNTSYDWGSAELAACAASFYTTFVVKRCLASLWMTSQTNSYDKIINLGIVLFDKDFYSWAENRGMEIKYGNITKNGIITVSKIKVPHSLRVEI